MMAFINNIAQALRRPHRHNEIHIALQENDMAGAIYGTVSHSEIK